MGTREGKKGDFPGDEIIYLAKDEKGGSVQSRAKSLTI